MCRDPKGTRQRAIHKRRRSLAGADYPKELILQERMWSHESRPEPPPLDGDLREILNDPLQDRTPSALARYEAECARKEVERARRLEESLQKIRANMPNHVDS